MMSVTLITSTKGTTTNNSMFVIPPCANHAQRRRKIPKFKKNLILLYLREWQISICYAYCHLLFPKLTGLPEKEIIPNWQTTLNGHTCLCNWHIYLCTLAESLGMCTQISGTWSQRNSRLEESQVIMRLQTEPKTSILWVCVHPALVFKGSDSCTKMRITGTAVFLGIWFSYQTCIYLMHKLILERIIIGKRSHERFLNSAWGVTSAYDADKGRFSDDRFIEIVVPNNNNCM